MAYGTVNADLMTTSDGVSSSGLYGFKNRIINGAMVIDQRNAGASVTISSAQYTLDRWKAEMDLASKYSVQQNAGSVTPPVGFTNYLGATSLSAYSVPAGGYYMLRQAIEGFNIGDLAWGTANAKTITLSFQVYSSLTGTFGGSLQNSATNRSYPFTYTISSANTWTSISITIAGDTTGTWLTTNGIGIWVNFGLGVGSTYSGTSGSWAGAGYFSATGATSVVGTNGATFYITGVQLEKGSTATSFDYRPYGTELQLCQRYYERITSVGASGAYMTYSSAQCISTSGANGPIFFQTKRASPTMNNSAASGFAVTASTDSAVALTTIGWSQVGVNVAQINGTGASGLTAGNATRILSSGNNTSYIEASAEL